MRLSNLLYTTAGAVAGVFSPIIQPPCRLYHQGKAATPALRRRWPTIGGQLADLYVFLTAILFFNDPSLVAVNLPPLPSVGYLMLSVPLIAGSVQGAIQGYQTALHSPELGFSDFCRRLWGMNSPYPEVEQPALAPYHEQNKQCTDQLRSGLLGAFSGMLLAPLMPIIQYIRQSFEADYTSPQCLSDLTITWGIFRSIWFLHGLWQLDYRLLGLIPATLAIYGGVRGGFQGYRAGLTSNELWDFANHFVEGGFSEYQTAVLNPHLKPVPSPVAHPQQADPVLYETELTLNLKIDIEHRQVLRLSSSESFHHEFDAHDCIIPMVEDSGNLPEQQQPSLACCHETMKIVEHRLKTL